jgi:Flp pilus assembly protein TadG
MNKFKTLHHDERGATVIEFAFAFPVLIVMLWAIVQLGFILRANAGIQQALGEGARFATLCPNPTILGCTPPNRDAIRTRMLEAVGGTELGTFNADRPTLLTDVSGARYYDLRVTYTMPTSLLLFPGPTVNLGKTKRVWVAS